MDWVKRHRFRLGASLICLAFLGLGLEGQTCADCDGRGGVHLSWYTLTITKLIDDLAGLDEYGSVELWPRLYGGACPHRWNSKGGILGVIPYEKGPPAHAHFERGRGVHALRALADVNPSWARQAWDSLREPDNDRKKALFDALEKFGVEALGAHMADEKLPPHYVVYWWSKNKGLTRTPASE